MDGLPIDRALLDSLGVPIPDVHPGFGPKHVPSRSSRRRAPSREYRKWADAQTKAAEWTLRTQTALDAGNDADAERCRRIADFWSRRALELSVAN